MLAFNTYFTFYGFAGFQLFLKATTQGLSHLSLLVDNLEHNPVALQKENIRAEMQAQKSEENASFFKDAFQQLDEYFAGERQEFTLQLAPTGTAFQEKVWQALQQIPYGSSQSYLDIANAIGNPKAVRAIGRANGANPIAIIIPCHRVIGASGKLTGYAYGLPLKSALLRLENTPFIGE